MDSNFSCISEVAKCPCANSWPPNASNALNALARVSISVRWVWGGDGNATSRRGLQRPHPPDVAAIVFQLLRHHWGLPQMTRGPTWNWSTHSGLQNRSRTSGNHTIQPASLYALHTERERGVVTTHSPPRAQTYFRLKVAPAVTDFSVFALNKRCCCKVDHAQGLCIPMEGLNLLVVEHETREGR